MIDSYGRVIEVLRMSVTDRCNYRCVYCMPPEGVPWLPPQEILSFEEIRDIAVAAIGVGIDRFRLTGGEPLVRKGIVSLVEMLAALPGINELTMTTNGALLAPLAAPLKAAGLQRINISLDTLDPDKFRLLTRGGDLRDALEGIDAAQAQGLTPVKLNIVVVSVADDRDARSVEEFARQHGLISRRIRQMDFPHGIYFPVENSTRGDCRRCNRLRLTSNGMIRSCLMSDLTFDVRRLGAGEALRCAAAAKPESGRGMHNASMSQVGG